MPVDWKNPATLEKLVAALFAAYGPPPNWNAVAFYFDSTRDTVEMKCRGYRSLSTKLVKEKGPFDKSSKVMPATPRKKSNVQTDGVAHGRVTKRTPGKSQKKKGSNVSSDERSEPFDSDEIMA